MKVNRYNYIDKKTGLQFAVFGSNEKFAQDLIDIENQYNEYHFEKNRPFVKIVDMDIRSIISLEESQIEDAKKDLERRKERLN